MKENKSKILSLLMENKSQINIAVKEDGREFEFDIDKVKKIISSVSNKKANIQKQNRIIFTNGNPYTSIAVLYKAVEANDKVLLCTEGKLSNLNKQLVRIFNQLCAKKMLEYKKDIKIRDLYLTTEKKSDILVTVIDNVNKYKELSDFGFNVNYKSMFTIDIYYDSEDYEDMVGIVEEYAISKYMDLNIFYDKSYEEMVIRSGSELSSLSLLILTKDPEKFDSLKDKFKEKNVYINYNPFDDYEENAIKKFFK